MTPGRRNLFLLLAGLTSLALFWPAFDALQAGKVALFTALAGGQAFLCLAAARLIWDRRSSRSTFAIVLAFAVLLRAAVLFQPPILSSDMYRYIWDGRVQAAGINPYRYVPAVPQLASLRDQEIYPHINRRDYAHTIYPPVAQIWFFAITRLSETVAWFKAALLGAEGVTIWALARLLGSFGLSRARVLIYAWNPLVLWELSATGHVDALMITLVTLALLARRSGRDSLTGVWLACAVLVKFIPLVLFPALYRRWNWKMPLTAAAVIAAGYLIYCSVGLGVFGFLPGYAKEEGLATGDYFLLLLANSILPGIRLPVPAYFAFTACLLGLLAVWALFRRSTDERAFLLAAAVLVFVFTFLLSPNYPWYWTWVIPFLCFLSWRMLGPFLYVTVAALVRYGHWFDHGQWFGLDSQLAKGLLQFAPFAIWLALAAILPWPPRLSRKISVASSNEEKSTSAASSRLD